MNHLWYRLIDKLYDWYIIRILSNLYNYRSIHVPRACNGPDFSLIDCVKDEEWLKRQQKLSDPYPPVQNGKYTFFLDDGIKYMEGSYKNGKEDGIFTVFYGSGEKYCDYIFKEGKIIEVINYNEDGEY